MRKRSSVGVGIVVILSVITLWMLRTPEPGAVSGTDFAMMNSSRATPNMLVGMVNGMALDFLQDVLDRDVGEEVVIDEIEARRMSLGEYKSLMHSAGVTMGDSPMIGNASSDADDALWVYVFRTTYPLHASGFTFATEEQIEYYRSGGGSAFVDASGLVTALVAVLDFDMEVVARQVLSAEEGADAFEAISALPEVEYTY